MPDPLLIYGASGHSGRLITAAALELGMRPIVSGRNHAKLAAVAALLGLEYRAAPLNDAAALDGVLRGVAVAVNAAGPFSQTAAAMAEACVRCGVHYLDITGEIAVIDALAARDGAARRAGVMLMPGVGFDVVPSDCLAAHVAGRLPSASRLAIGLTGLVWASPGSAKTLLEHIGFGVKVRRGGALVSLQPGAVTRTFDFGRGPQPAMNISWGDVASAYYTTGIPNIDVFYAATPALHAMLLASRYAGWWLRTDASQALLKAAMDWLPAAPSDEQRATAPMVIVAEVHDDTDRCARARLRTPEAYTFTGSTAAAVAVKVLRGDYEIGFQTPARVYGADFVLGFPGVTREDLPSA